MNHRYDQWPQNNENRYQNVIIKNKSQEKKVNISDHKKGILTIKENAGQGFISCTYGNEK